MAHPLISFALWPITMYFLIKQKIIFPRVVNGVNCISSSSASWQLKKKIGNVGLISWPLSIWGLKKIKVIMLSIYLSSLGSLYLETAKNYNKDPSTRHCVSSIKWTLHVPYHLSILSLHFFHFEFIFLEHKWTRKVYSIPNEVFQCLICWHLYFPILQGNTLVDTWWNQTCFLWLYHTAGW